MPQGRYLIWISLANASDQTGQTSYRKHLKEFLT